MTQTINQIEAHTEPLEFVGHRTPEDVKELQELARKINGKRFRPVWSFMMQDDGRVEFKARFDPDPVEMLVDAKDAEPSVPLDSLTDELALNANPEPGSAAAWVAGQRGGDQRTGEAPESQDGNESPVPTPKDVPKPQPPSAPEIIQ